MAQRREWDERRAAAERDWREEGLQRARLLPVGAHEGGTAAATQRQPEEERARGRVPVVVERAHPRELRDGELDEAAEEAAPRSRGRWRTSASSSYRHGERRDRLPLEHERAPQEVVEREAHRRATRSRPADAGRQREDLDEQDLGSSNSMVSQPAQLAEAFFKPASPECAVGRADCRAREMTRVSLLELRERTGVNNARRVAPRRRWLKCIKFSYESRAQSQDTTSLAASTDHGTSSGMSYHMGAWAALAGASACARRAAVLLRRRRSQPSRGRAAACRARRPIPRGRWRPRSSRPRWRTAREERARLAPSGAYRG